MKKRGCVHGWEMRGGGSGGGEGTTIIACGKDKKRKYARTAKENEYVDVDGDDSEHAKPRRTHHNLIS